MHRITHDPRSAGGSQGIEAFVIDPGPPRRQCSSHEDLQHHCCLTVLHKIVQLKKDLFVGCEALSDRT